MWFGWLKRKHVGVAFALVAVGSLVAGLDYSFVKRALEGQLSQRLIIATDPLIRSTETAFSALEAGVETVASLLAETRDESVFNAVTSQLKTPALSETATFEYVRRVVDREAFELNQTARLNALLDTQTSYFIRDVGGEGPSGEREEYYAVTYINPTKGNEKAFLLDLASEEVRRRGLLDALEKQKTVASGPIELIQGGVSSLVFSPVLDGSGDLALTIMRTSQILDRIEGIFEGDYYIEIWDSTAGVLMGERGNVDVHSSFRAETFEFGGREFETRVFGVSSLSSVEAGVISATLVLPLLVFVIIATFYLVLVYQHHMKEEEIKHTLENTHALWLGYMMHAIRTPVHSLRYLSGALWNLHQQGKTDEERLEMLKATTNQLSDLVNSYIDLSAIDTENVQIINRTTDVCALAKDVFHQYTIMAKDSRIRMRIKIRPEVSNVKLKIDPVRVRQILSNGLSNAHKYTSRGRIDMNVRLSKNGLYVLFVITDTGQGIRDASKLGNQFERGEGAARPRDPNSATAGLGLAISRELAKKMGAWISVGNRGDGQRGAEFVLGIPYDPMSESSDQSSTPDQSTEESSSNEEKLASDDVRVVVRDDRFEKITVAGCEDDYVNRCAMTDMLTNIGVSRENVVLFSDGEDLVDFYGSGEFPDVFLLDIFMKRMNGDEVVENLRDMGLGSVPCVAVTGNVVEQDVERYFESGFSDVLRKPFEDSDLRKCLKKVLGMN